MSGEIPIQGTLAPNGAFPIIDGDAVIPWHGAVVQYIYARTTGNDSTGDGTLANPYLTVDRALEDVPSFINGVKYIIDMTGLIGANAWRPDGTRLQLPARVRLGANDAPRETYTNPDFARFDSLADVNFQAVPSLDPTGGLLGVFGVDYNQSHDVETGIVTLNDLTGTKNWPVNGLVGKLVAGSVAAALGKIVSNTANTIVVAANHVPFNTNNPGVYNLTGEIKPQDSATFAAIELVGGASVSLKGLIISKNNHGGTIGNALTVGNAAWAGLQGCDINGISLAASAPGIDPNFVATFDGCYVTGVVDTSGSGIFSNCFFDSIGAFFKLLPIDGAITFNTVYAKNCAPLGNTSITNNYSSPEVPFEFGDWNIEGCLVEGATSHGIQCLGGRVHIGAYHCVSAAGSAVYGRDSSVIAFGQRIKSETAGVARYGLEIADGVRAHGMAVGDGVQFGLSGTLGDLKVGTLPPRTLADFTTNAPIGRQIDYNDLSAFTFPADGSNGIVGPTGKHATGAIMWVQSESTFAQMLSIINAVVAQRGQAVVYMDDGGTFDAFVFDTPANLDRVKFVGVSQYSSMTVTFAAGFQLLGTRMDFTNCNITTQTTIWDSANFPPGSYIDWRFDMSEMVLDIGAPPVAIVDLAYIILEKTGGLAADTQFPSTQGPLFQINDGGFFNMWMYSQSAVQAGCFGLTPAATGASLFFGWDDTCDYDTVSYPDHPLEAGIELTRSLVGSQNTVVWTPADDWLTIIHPRLVAAVDMFGSATLLITGGAVMNTPVNLDNVQIVGITPSATISIEPGFSLLGAGNLHAKDITIDVRATLFSGDGAFWDFDNAQLQQVSGFTEPALICNNANVTLRNGASMLGAKNFLGVTLCVAVQLSDGGGIFFSMRSQSMIDLSTVGAALGATSVSLSLNAIDSTCLAPTTGYAPEITFAVGPLGNVAFAPYTPTAGLFSDPQPTTAEDALNRIAALVKTLNGGTPIP